MGNKRTLHCVVFTDDAALFKKLQRCLASVANYQIDLRWTDQLTDVLTYQQQQGDFDVLIIDYPSLMNKKSALLSMLSQISVSVRVLLSAKMPIAQHLDLLDMGVDISLDRNALTKIVLLNGIHMALKANVNQIVELDLVADSTLDDNAISSQARNIKKLLHDFQQENEQLQQLAHYDAVTGLPNRVQFEKSIERIISRAKRHALKFALLCIDVDNFKQVNDNRGHWVGDILLKSIGLRLQANLRGEDFVARIGGDEFVVILSDLKQYDDAGLVADKLMQAMRAPFQYEQQEFSVSISVGIACYPLAGQTLPALFQNADAALYRAKAQGKNDYQYYKVSVV